MTEAEEIWDTGVQIIFEQWKLLLDDTDPDNLTRVWNDILDVTNQFDLGFDDWMEGRE